MSLLDFFPVFKPKNENDWAWQVYRLTKENVRLKNENSGVKRALEASTNAQAELYRRLLLVESEWRYQREVLFRTEQRLLVIRDEIAKMIDHRMVPASALSNVSRILEMLAAQEDECIERGD